MKYLKHIKTMSIIAIAFLCLMAVFAISCKSMIAPASQSSWPVQTQAATTNDPMAVAYVKMAEQVNSEIPSPLQPLIGQGLIGIQTLLSCFIGFYARHSIATNKPPQA